MSEMKHNIFCCVIKTYILRLVNSILSHYRPVLMTYTEIKLGHELQMNLGAVIVSFAENLLKCHNDSFKRKSNWTIWPLPHLREIRSNVHFHMYWTALTGISLKEKCVLFWRLSIGFWFVILGAETQGLVWTWF